MKTTIFFLFFVFFITGINAQDKGFGLGIIVGEPTGLSGKGWISKTSAIDGGLAWSFLDDGSLHIHADYLWHNFDVITPRIPLYIGVGGRMKFKNNKTAKDDKIGVRVPVGVAFFISEPTSDFFVEIVPILDLAPKSAVTFNAAIGFRFFFK
jgi:hypothetical protein